MTLPRRFYWDAPSQSMPSRAFKWPECELPRPVPGCPYLPERRSAGRSHFPDFGATRA